MKNPLLIVVAALSVAAAAFAGDNGPLRVYYIQDGHHTANFSAELFQQITGEFENEVQRDVAWYTNSIEITPDEVVKARVAAQVGRDSGQFLYPTTCLLDYQGKIKTFYLEKAAEHSDELSLYLIEMAGPKLTLVASPKNSPQCEEYIRINNNVTQLTWYWIKFSIRDGALIEQGGKHIYDRIGPSQPADRDKN